MKTVQPSVKDSAFSCPRCGALAHQHWYEVWAEPLGKDRLPMIFRMKDIEEHLEGIEVDHHEDAISFIETMSVNDTFLGGRSPKSIDHPVNNLWISKCFNCDKISLWLRDSLIYPVKGDAPVPNADLPNDVLEDYEEAGRVLSLSPRGSAALLRLCIQKLCKHLGQPGKNINNDIGALVKAGLDIRVQQALDLVRVIGNNAVHPGQIDLKDDRDTAARLFELVNLVADIMITQPKQVDALYSKLPQSSIDQISRRDRTSS